MATDTVPTAEELNRTLEAACTAAKLASEGDEQASETAMQCFQTLKLFKVTTQLLVDTQGGKKLRALTKHQDLNIKATAAEIVNIWKGTVAAESSAIEKSKKQLGGLQPINPSTVPGISQSDSLTQTSTQNSDVTERSAKRQRTEPISLTTTPQKSIQSQAPVTPSSSTAAPVYDPSKQLDVPQTADPDRNKLRSQIAAALDLAAADCPGADVGGKAAELESAVLAQNGKLTAKYKAKIRSIWVNLKDPKNPDFRKAVLLGDISGAEAVNLKPEEMASKSRQEENQKIREAAMFEAERGKKRMATTDQFQCGKCKKNQTSYYQMQTRSADEPMTTFVICMNCDNRWKFC